MLAEGFYTSPTCSCFTLVRECVIMTIILHKALWSPLKGQTFNSQIQLSAVITWSNIRLYITFSTAVIGALHKSEFVLTGELWGVNCEDFGDIWPCCNSTMLLCPLASPHEQTRGHLLSSIWEKGDHKLLRVYISGLILDLRPANERRATL